MEKKDKEEDQAGYLNNDPKKKMYDRLGSLGNSRIWILACKCLWDILESVHVENKGSK